jgi:hypothetical protein
VVTSLTLSLPRFFISQRKTFWLCCESWGFHSWNPQAQFWVRCVQFTNWFL